MSAYRAMIPNCHGCGDRVTECSCLQIWDYNGCRWRLHPDVPGEWQIQIPSGEWSDADLFPDYGPFKVVCGLPLCRICPINCELDSLPEAVRLAGHGLRREWDA